LNEIPTPHPNMAGYWQRTLASKHGVGCAPGTEYCWHHDVVFNSRWTSGSPAVTMLDEMRGVPWYHIGTYKKGLLPYQQERSQCQVQDSASPRAMVHPVARRQLQLLLILLLSGLLGLATARDPVAATPLGPGPCYGEECRGPWPQFGRIASHSGASPCLGPALCHWSTYGKPVMLLRLTLLVSAAHLPWVVTARCTWALAHR
jgi:hypothetical protein